jgi:D-alanyl-D-alanine-carboxypeptidase/D-alanyl-D-alanine-endopeptidase
MHQDPSATATYIPARQLRWTQGMGRAGIPTGIGLGWVHLNEPDDPAMIIEKTGGGAGYNTYIALNPGRKIAIFVAATDGLHDGPEIFRGSNEVLTYLAGLTPVLEDSVQLAADAHHSDLPVRDATVHKRHKHPARQVARTSAAAAGQ